MKRTKRITKSEMRLERAATLREAAAHPQHHVFSLSKGTITHSECACGVEFPTQGSCEVWQKHILALGDQLALDRLIADIVSIRDREWVEGLGFESDPENEIPALIINEAFDRHDAELLTKQRYVSSDTIDKLLSQRDAELKARYLRLAASWRSLAGNPADWTTEGNKTDTAIRIAGRATMIKCAEELENV